MIHRALTMSAEERSLRAGRLREIVDGRDPGVWIDDQLADIRASEGASTAARRRRRSGSRVAAPHLRGRAAWRRLAAPWLAADRLPRRGLGVGACSAPTCGCAPVRPRPRRTRAGCRSCARRTRSTRRRRPRRAQGKRKGGSRWRHAAGLDRGSVADLDTGAKLAFKFVPGQGRYWKFRDAAQFELWDLDARRRPHAAGRGRSEAGLLPARPRAQPSADEGLAEPAPARAAARTRTDDGHARASVGWSDVYPSSYHQNWIELDHLPSRLLRLRPHRRPEERHLRAERGEQRGLDSRLPDQGGSYKPGRCGGVDDRRWRRRRLRTTSRSRRAATAGAGTEAPGRRLRRAGCRRRRHRRRTSGRSGVGAGPVGARALGASSSVAALPSPCRPGSGSLGARRLVLLRSALASRSGSSGRGSSRSGPPPTPPSVAPVAPSPMSAASGGGSGGESRPGRTQTRRRRRRADRPDPQRGLPAHPLASHAPYKPGGRPRPLAHPAAQGLPR